MSSNDFNSNAFCVGGASIAGLFIAAAFAGWQSGQQQAYDYDPEHDAEMQRMADDMAVARARIDQINAAIDYAIANPTPPPAPKSRARTMREIAAEIAAIRDRHINCS